MDSLTWYVMDALADDWESIEEIRPHIAEYHGSASDREIFDTLRALHARDLVRLMDENGYGTGEFPDDPNGYWFSMTEAGRALWDAEGEKYRSE